MFHFHDVDILLKLAACDLLRDLDELLAVSPADVKVLETAIFKIRSLGKKGIYTERVISQAIRFCEGHDEIPSLQSTTAADALTSLGAGMDAGEVILFSSALENAASRVVTGDKRALRMLGKLGKEHDLVRNLQGRVVCFEELLLRTFEAHGFDYLCKHSHAGADHDGLLRLAFRSGLATEQSEALEGIHSAWRALNRESSGLLVDRFVPGKQSENIPY
jgi:hypothetical protein